MSSTDDLVVNLQDDTDLFDVTMEDSTDTFDIELKDNVVQIGGSEIYQDTTANWDAQRTLIAKKDAIYVYLDYADDEPGIKIGDGKAYLIDLPFVSGSTNTEIQVHIENDTIHITQAERELWNGKVRCFISQQDPENLVFTTN